MLESLDSRIAEMRCLLETDDGKRDPELVAFMIRDWPETREYDLYDLVYLLARGEYGCHVNDVKGLLDSMEERWLAESK